MSAELAESDPLAAIRREVERNALRARNGLKYLVGGRFVRTAATPRDLVWRRGKTELWRYRSDQVTRRPPILCYVGLVGRPYVLDLYRGDSFVQKLQRAGFDVFLLDWGAPDEADAGNTIATYALEHLPAAVEEVLRASGEREVTLFGYCMGGCLTLAALGAGVPLPVHSAVLVAVPTDFWQLGPFFAPIRDGTFDVESAIDETGNVPPSLVNSFFRVRKPTADLVVYANLWQNLWNDEYMEGFQAMNEWVNDQVPFAGAAFREFAREWLVPNGIVNGTAHVGGRKIDLGRIHCPTLCVVAEHDDFVPLPAAEPLPALLTGIKAEVARLPVGHVNLVIGRRAEQLTIPAIVGWLDRHAETKAA